MRYAQTRPAQARSHQRRSSLLSPQAPVSLVEYSSVSRRTQSLRRSRSQCQASERQTIILICRFQGRKGQDLTCEQAKGGVNSCPRWTCGLWFGRAPFIPRRSISFVAWLSEEPPTMVRSPFVEFLEANGAGLPAWFSKILSANEPGTSFCGACISSIALGRCAQPETERSGWLTVLDICPVLSGSGDAGVRSWATWLHPRRMHGI